MGEINLNNPGHSVPRTKPKKLSTRVDLTPMVDLGFLLITFFIFTTTISDPTAMKLVVPKDTLTDRNKIPEGKTLNIIIGGNNNISFYHGSNIDLIKTVNNAKSGIRDIIIQKKKDLTLRSESADDLIILIKPTSEATYENIVNVLDEMTINNIRHFVLMEPSEEDLKAVEMM